MTVSDLQYQLSFYDGEAEVKFATNQGEYLETSGVRNARYDADKVVITEA